MTTQNKLLTAHQRAMSPRQCERDAVEQWLEFRHLGWAPYGPQPDSMHNRARNDARSKPLIWC